MRSKSSKVRRIDRLEHRGVSIEAPAELSGFYIYHLQDGRPGVFDTGLHKYFSSEDEYIAECRSAGISTFVAIPDNGRDELVEYG